MIRAAGYVELGSDEGAFVIRGNMGSLDAEPWDANTLVTVPDDVTESGDVLILTGDQWGPFAVTTHVLDSRPDLDPEWEDVVEFSPHMFGWTSGRGTRQPRSVDWSAQ